MSISPNDVKTLRDRTSLPMMECKAALVEAGGDIEKAIELLRKKFANAKLKEGRETAEGRVAIFIDPAATMFLLGSEMDYIEDKFHTGFTFKNPNEKGRCGCGESFTV